MNRIMRQFVVDNVYNIVYVVDIVTRRRGRSREMNQTNQPRKIRKDLSTAEKERLEKFGSLNFKSPRRPDWRVEKFVPSREQH
jgi:hypothetical protein